MIVELFDVTDWRKITFPIDEKIEKTLEIAVDGVFVGTIVDDSDFMNCLYICQQVYAEFEWLV